MHGRLFLVAAAVALAAIGSVAALAGSNDAGTAVNPNWPANKQAKMQEALNRQATARALNVAKPPNSAPGPPEAIPARIGGLIKGLGQSPFSPTAFQSNSTWSGPVNGVWVQIYAGADVTGPVRVGELRGFTMPVDPNAGPAIQNLLATLMPPMPEPGLSLTAIQGNVLTVTSSTGDTFAFDVASRTWTKQ